MLQDIHQKDFMLMSLTTLASLTVAGYGLTDQRFYSARPSQ